MSVLLDSNNPKAVKAFTLREQVWMLFDDPASSVWAQFVAIWVMALIVISCISFVVETDLAYHNMEYPIFSYIEYVCIVQFTIEYLVRLISCPDKVDFLYNFMNTVDLVAILPFYIEKVSGELKSTGFLRVIRLARVFRVFKISRYLTWITVFVNAIKTSAQPMFMLLYVMMIALVFFSSIMYFLERGVFDEENNMYMRKNPLTFAKEPSPYQSIPGTFWWCIITMTTVGYGDTVPVTWQGRLLASVASLCGILVFAVPITVISKAFDSEIHHMRQLDKLGISKLRQLKAAMMAAYRREKEECRGSERIVRKSIMTLLLRHLQSSESNFNWNLTTQLESRDLRAILIFYVSNQISAVISESNKYLAEKIENCIEDHKRDIQYEINTLLYELIDSKSATKYKNFQSVVKDMFLERELMETLNEKWDRQSSGSEWD